ncbi:hypothetical protein [Nocardia macrotermitis]|uniref:Uncharacterized protein n=1 Tax=Nocardia macrotermitis TaxID=2585198 RepID=A0A7K0D3V8_9NOCA|nr:hypothetical protein [Nocardia macrotermitis]MQY20425.1 hypothetical protein [Nocardia macrotermitis]
MREPGSAERTRKLLIHSRLRQIITHAREEAVTMPRIPSERWEEIALSFFLFVCFLLAFFKDLFPFLEKGLTAAMFAAVFFVLKQIRDLRIAVQETKPTQLFFATNEEFYDSAREAVHRGTQEVRVTYFRDVPASDLSSEESHRYFDEVVDFARRKGTVRRIVGIANDAMAEWCATQLPLVRHNPRYHVRIIDTTNQVVEPMNICLIDNDIIYMAFSGPTDQQLGGMRVDGPELARFHQNRFDQLWGQGTDLEDFIAMRTAATGVPPS